jgi:hypothetical protein
MACVKRPDVLPEASPGRAGIVGCVTVALALPGASRPAAAPGAAGVGEPRANLADAVGYSFHARSDRAAHPSARCSIGRGPAAGDRPSADASFAMTNEAWEGAALARSWLVHSGSVLRTVTGARK